jgi:hypothetical protein
MKPMESRSIYLQLVLLSRLVLYNRFSLGWTSAGNWVDVKSILLVVTMRGYGWGVPNGDAAAHQLPGHRSAGGQHAPG